MQTLQLNTPGIPGTDVKQYLIVEYHNSLFFSINFLRAGFDMMQCRACFDMID